MGFFAKVAEKFAGFAGEEKLVSTAIRGVEETLPVFTGKEEEYLYHVTDVSRAESIRKGGLRAGSWFAKTPEETLRAGVAPISGDIRDLRIFAVPKHAIQEVAADAADMGARLIEQGKYLQTGAAVRPTFEVPIEQAAAKAFPKKVAMQKLADQTAQDMLMAGAGNDNTSLLKRGLKSVRGSHKTSVAL